MSETKTPEVKDLGTENNSSDAGQEVPPVIKSEETTTEKKVEEVAAPKVVQAAPTTPAAKNATAEKQQPESQLTKIIERINEAGTSLEKNLLFTFNEYIKKMAPKVRVLGDDGARQQYMLWLTIRNVVNDSPNNEFKSLWNTILSFFNEYKEGVFAETHVFRFSEFWQWDKKELDAFQRIVNLIKLTADPKSRATNLRQIDMNRALVFPINDTGRTRLLSFYSK